MVTSPYLRCVQTAIHLVKNIKCELYKNTIYLSYGLGEFFKENWFNRDVLDELVAYRSKSNSQPEQLGKLFDSEYNISEVEWE